MPLLHYCIFFLLFFAVFSTPYHLFSSLQSTFLYNPQIFLCLSYSAPIVALSLLCRYTHPVGRYERSLQPAHTSPPAYPPGATATTHPAPPGPIRPAFPHLDPLVPPPSAAAKQRASSRRGSSVRGASLLREGGVSTARERRHRRGRYSAWEGRHSGAGGAWEGRHRGVGGGRHRGVVGAWEGRHCGVRAASARRWSSVIAAAARRGRGVTVAWQRRGRGVTASWKQ